MDITAPNNYVVVEGVGRACPQMEALSLETVAQFEPDDYVIKYVGENGWSANMGSSFSALDGVLTYADWNGPTLNPWGITSDRMYYTAAECLIRTGKVSEGLALVNKVRALRVENATPLSATTEAEAMALMQPAKWIECIGSYENFFDLKRWNSEPAYARTITRRLGEYGTFTLAPQSPLWIFPFPATATNHNSELTHNY